MKLYKIEAELVSTAPTGKVESCALAYTFAAAIGGRYKGLVIWDMVGCVPVRQLHTHLLFGFIHIKES